MGHGLSWCGDCEEYVYVDGHDWDSPHGKRIKWAKCANADCGHYGGEHDRHGCQCIVVMRGREYKCGCCEFKAPRRKY